MQDFEKISSIFCRKRIVSLRFAPFHLHRSFPTDNRDLLADKSTSSLDIYSVFHRFRQAEFYNSSSILSSSQFLLLPQRPLKMTIDIKVVKIDSKIIIWLPQSKSAEQAVENICGYICGCVCFFKCVCVCVFVRMSTCACIHLPERTICVCFLYVIFCIVVCVYVVYNIFEREV